LLTKLLNEEKMHVSPTNPAKMKLRGCGAQTIPVKQGGRLSATFLLFVEVVRKEVL